MWVSRNEWETLVKRVEVLEKDKQDRRYTDNFTVYPGGAPIPPDPWPKGNDFLLTMYARPWYGPSQDIAVKDVLEKVLRHLGIRLRYKAGSPANVEIELPSSDAAPHADQKESE